MKFKLHNNKKKIYLCNNNNNNYQMPIYQLQKMNKYLNNGNLKSIQNRCR